MQLGGVQRAEGQSCGSEGFEQEEGTAQWGHHDAQQGQMQSPPLGTEQPHATVQAGNYPVGEQLCRKETEDPGLPYPEVHNERTKDSQIPTKYKEKKNQKSWLNTGAHYSGTLWCLHPQNFSKLDKAWNSLI